MNTNSCAAANRGNSHFRRADRAVSSGQRWYWLWLLPATLFAQVTVRINHNTQKLFLAVTRARYRHQGYGQRRSARLQGQRR